MALSISSGVTILGGGEKETEEDGDCELSLSSSRGGGDGEGCFELRRFFFGSKEPFLVVLDERGSEDDVEVVVAVEVVRCNDGGTEEVEEDRLSIGGGIVNSRINRVKNSDTSNTSPKSISFCCAIFALFSVVAFVMVEEEVMVSSDGIGPIVTSVVCIVYYLGSNSNYRRLFVR